MHSQIYGKILPKGSEHYSRHPIPAHPHLLRAGSQVRGKVSRLSAGAAVSCPPFPGTCCLTLFLRAATGPSPVLCPCSPRVDRYRWFAARRRVLPISPHSVGPTMLDAASIRVCAGHRVSRLHRGGSRMPLS